MYETDSITHFKVMVIKFAIIAALLLTSCGHSMAQDAKPLPVGPAVSGIDLRKLDAAARKQNAVAGPDDAVNRKDVRQLTIAPKTPPGIVQTLPLAQQQKLIKKAEDAVKTKFKPGTPKYSYALDAALSGIKTELQSGKTVSPAIVVDRDPPAIFKSLTFIKNRGVIGDLRIVGSTSAGFNDYLDCVAICRGPTGQSFASGTLIGKNVVLTAAHVAVDPNAKYVFIGLDTNKPSPTPRIEVVRAIRHPSYDPKSRVPSSHDIALLILASNVETVPLRALAVKADVESAQRMEIVGFGYTDASMNNLGVKTKAFVAVGSNFAAVGQELVGQETKFGFKTSLEFIAGGFGIDSCRGDSGGPAYQSVGNAVKVAGVTSRSVANSTRVCGDGGIYTRVDTYFDWIVGVARSNGGILP